MTHDVGDVLYVIPHGKTLVVPVRVIEVVTRKTLQGEKTAYLVTDQHGKEGKLPEDTRVYRSPDDVRTALYESMRSRIDAVIVSAVDAAAGLGAPSAVRPEQAEIDDDGRVLVELPDGSVARVKSDASLSE